MEAIKRSELEAIKALRSEDEPIALMNKKCRSELESVIGDCKCLACGMLRDMLSMAALVEAHDHPRQ